MSLPDFGATDDQRRMARLYALIHRGNPGDIDFYREICAGAPRVLELGCGEGRILAPLLDAHPEAEIWGLDLDPGALAEAAQRPQLQRAAATGRGGLVAGDMRSFTLPGLFDVIIIPYNGLYTLGDLDGVRGCLRSAAKHLAPGGRLIFDGYAVDDDAAEAELWVDPPDPAEAQGDPWCEGGYSYLITVLDLEQRVDVYEQEQAVGLPRRIDALYRFVIRSATGGDPEIIEQRVDHHFITPGMVPRLMMDAGLTLDHVWGDFDRRPLTEDDERLVVQASRA